MKMKKNKQKKILLDFFHYYHKKIALFTLVIFLSISTVVSHWIWQIKTELTINATKPVDSIFVLGGSINREIYVSKIANKYPQVPILISQGSKDPCIFLIFARKKVDPSRVWLEKCAKNTFGNFVSSVPILVNWKAHHVKLITSKTHLPRSKWMAQIFFGMYGIWVETDIAPEKGVPGNQESYLKTFLDVTRSLLWSLMFHPETSECNDIISLKDIDISSWITTGFKCENQAKLNNIIDVLRDISQKKK
jgi:uncharacterized SAM-binding protein YcdF (DUF218 family)